MCRIRDGNDGRILQPALDGYRVKAFHNALRVTDDGRLVVTSDFLCYGRWGGKQSGPGLAKCFQQCAVLEFSDDARADIVRIEKLIERAAEGTALDRQ